jgi:hypothetical protein
MLTAIAFCLCLATHCGRVGACHAAMSAGDFPLPFLRLPTEEGLLPATPQLLFAASTHQAPSASELRKHPSCVRSLFAQQNLNVKVPEKAAVDHAVEAHGRPSPLGTAADNTADGP